MLIMAREKDLRIKVKEDDRVIFDTVCFNLIHFELIKKALKDLKNNKKVDEALLKPLKD